MARVNEGPYMLYNEDDGLYYLTYSGSHFESINYGSGYAVADNPMGPFTKYEQNPIMKSNTLVHGAGHHCVTTSPDGKELFMVYHCHQNLTTTEPRQLCIDRMQFTTDESGTTVLEVKGPTLTPQALPSGAQDVENFIRFDKLDDVVVVEGATADELTAALPTEVTMYTSKSEYTLPVTWDVSAYDSNAAEDITIKGSVEVPDGVVGDYYQNASFEPEVKVAFSKPVLHYAIDETAGTTLVDSVGDYDGTLVGTTSFVNALGDSAVQLGGGEDYIKVPNEALASDTVSISAWVRPDKVENWTTLLAAGSGQDNYAIFAVKGNPSNNEVGLTMAIKANGGQEYRVAAPADMVLPANEWSLVTYTQTGTTATLFVNGEQVGQTTSMMSSIKDVLAANENANVRIGDNHIWPDPSLNGAVAEVWVYNHAITANELKEEVAAKAEIIAKEAIDTAADTFTLGDTSNVTAHLQLPQSFVGAQIEWSSSDETVVGADGSVNQSSTEDKEATLTAVFYHEDTEYTRTVEYKVTVPALTEESKEASLLLHYEMKESADVVVDSKGNYDGTLVGNTSWVSGLNGAAVQLGGGEDYIKVPNAALNQSRTVTVSAWIKPDTIATWTSLFVAGSGQDNYAILAAKGTPFGNEVGLTMAIKENGGEEKRVAASAGVTLPVGEWSLVTYTQTGTTATLFLNG